MMTTAAGFHLCLGTLRKDAEGLWFDHSDPYYGSYLVPPEVVASLVIDDGLYWATLAYDNGVDWEAGAHLVALAPGTRRPWAEVWADWLDRIIKPKDPS